MDLQTRGSFQMRSKEMQKAGVLWEAGVWGFGRIADAGIDRQCGHVSLEEALHKSHQGEKVPVSLRAGVWKGHGIFDSAGNTCRQSASKCVH